MEYSLHAVRDREVHLISSGFGGGILDPELRFRFRLVSDLATCL